MTPATIRAIREALGMTGAQLGEALGLGAGAAVTVSRWENGARAPRHPTWLRARLREIARERGKLAEVKKVMGANND